MRARAGLVFGLLLALACGAVYRAGLWGGALLAPVDLAPALLPRYQFVEPGLTVPANHYIADQLVYDLPVQRTLHAAIQRGELPWWDPYTLGGRPLLADAHINGTDPVRLLLYALLPFEAAYNGTLVLHAVLAALGMFLLLGRLGIRDAVRLPLALAFPFAGAFTLYFGHPWIAGAFLYYPFLWWAWDAGLRDGSRRALPAAALAVAGLLYAGNLQSHAYLPLFAAAVAFGYAGLRLDAWKRALPLLAGSALLGALLALPVLTAQIELFAGGLRTADAPAARFGWAAGPLSLSAVFPWMLGTFRTLDASKLAGQTALGFHLWIGSAAVALAAYRLVHFRGDAPAAAPALRTARFLVLGYLLLASTPLVRLLYLRIAPLAAAGLVVLAAAEAESLLAGPRRPRLAAALLALALGLAAGANLFALAVYPRLEDRVARLVAERPSAALPPAPALRAFQVANLPRELSVLNPETGLALLGLAALAYLYWEQSEKRRRRAAPAVLALNLLPLLLFAGRFVPHAPMDQWRRLQAGGDRQRALREQTRGRAVRVAETLPAPEQVFPYALAHLQQVHVEQGYAALRPVCLAFLDPRERDLWHLRLAHSLEPDSPWLEVNRFRGKPAGEVRFREPALGTIVLDFAQGAAGPVLLTDTHYPGWTAKADGVPVALEKNGPCFSRVDVPPGARQVVLRYRPRFRALGWAGAGAGLLGLVLAASAGQLKRKG